MFYSENEHDVLCITTDADDNGDVDSYNVTFDTRTIIKEGGVYKINENYLSFRLYDQNNQLLKIVTIDSIYGENNVVKPNNDI
jgi:hypothetical protein